MRLWKFFAKWMTCSAMLSVCALLAFTSVGCADEVLKCCKCSYATCTDMKGAMVPQTICSCDSYTYAECGAYCQEDVPAQLEAAGFTGCGEPASLAVDAC